MSISMRISLLTFALTVSLVGSVSADFPVGDLNGDCDVNLPDLKIFVEQWLDPSGCSAHPNDCADLDGVNGINSADFALLAANWLIKTGSLQVTILPPEAAAAGAQWCVDGGAWHDNNDIEGGLIVGSHTVEYKTITGWNEPNSRAVQINDGQTTTTTGIYIQHTGSLQVTILPLEVALAGAQWCVDGGAWRDSEYIESGLLVGSHTIEYKAMVGWNTPANENVQINNGQTTTTSGTYIQQTGSLQVTIFPQEAIDAGAQWRVDDGAWRDSNYTETGLLVGFYSVEFSVVVGWDRPANLMVQINYNQTTTTSSAYIRQILEQLTINEFMASNASELPLDPGELLDGDGESSDWIEIYNQTDESVSLDGWFLTDDDDDLTRWQFPDDLQIYAGEYLIVFASGKTYDLYPLNYPYLDSDDYYHTNFNLDSPGEYLALVAPDGNTIVYEYEPEYPEQLTNVSYGLAHYEVTLVPTGATASYHVPAGADAALGTDWADVGFDDLAWDTGPTALGFGGGVGTDIQQEMLNVNASLWMRIDFNLEEGQRDLFDTFMLRIKYEDGFVAYLNGQEVTSRNAPNSLEWNSIADSNRPIADSAVFEVINLMPFLDTLQIGGNVLAIHGLNDDPADDEFLILPELVAASSIDVPQYFITATPGELNVADAMGLVGEVWFSHERGYYDTGFQLELSTAMDSAEIRYTIDGSCPTITHGIVYTGPIDVSQTTTVRAIAVRPGWLSINADAHTYIFLFDVADQPAFPPGFPTSWAGYTADYEVDPDVVDNTLPGHSFEEALLWIPSVCITMLTDDLFGADDGIYVYSTSTGDEWERPASIELIYPDGRDGFQINAGVHLHGGASRNHSSTLKHSFRLVFRGIYGPTKLNFPLFQDSDVEEFDQLVLRGSSGDSWTYPDSYRDGVIRHIKIQAQYTRDPWMKDSQRAMGHHSANSIFVNLYLNGLYWGQYNLCERPNSAFQASYLGGDKDDYDTIHDYEELQSGTFDIWNQMFDLAAAGLAGDADAQFIQGNNPDGTRNPNYPILLDVDNLIDYMILHHFARSEDWPCHNFWSGRRRGPLSEGFKFFVWDQENHNNTLERFITGCGCHIEVLPGEEARSLRPGYLYARLRENPMFRRKFSDQVHKHMFNGGLLTIEKVEERWMKRAAEVDKSVVAESARWGDAKRTVPYKREVEFLTEQNRLHTEYWPYISAIVLDRYRGVELYPDIHAPVFRINDVNQHGGNISNTDELTMDNPNGSGTIYYTTDGNDPRLPESTQIYGTTLVAEDATKKVLVPTGSVNDNWKGDGPFNDSSWNDGTFISGKFGGVGYEEGSGYEPYISYDVKAKMYNGNNSCYIRIPFTLEGDPCDFNFMSLNIRYDDGFIAYLNGDELERKNFSLTATPAWNSNATVNHEASGFETIPVSDHLDSLQQGDNILAIHGLNIHNTSSDFLISAELVASDVNSTTGGVSPYAIEYNNEHLTFNKSTHVKACVLDGDTWSALNEAVYGVGPVAENLRITEIMYHPRYTGDPNDPNTEYVELKNIGPGALNLNLAEFTKGIDFTFPETELDPGEYVVVVKDIGAFEAKYSTSVNIAGQYTGSLANDGERIKLRDAVGRTILDFEYGDGWRSITDGDGFSLTIIDPTDSEPNNWDQKESWRASVYRNGSPGADDSGILPNPGAVVINEVMSHSNAGPDWIELHNTTGEAINIGGWFLSDNDRSEPNLAKYRIADGTTIDANDYLVFYQDADFNNPGDPGCLIPFALSENGEEACLSSPLDPSSMLTGYREVEGFGAS
ncbi:MAG: lamin tail domain-containing protein, partial [Sedimentisphaerales bacterium]